MGAFEDFVNANLGVRMPLFIDTTTPELSSKSAGSLGSKFVDSTTNYLYEKTGFTNADWVKIADLGEVRKGAGVLTASDGQPLFSGLFSGASFIADDTSLGIGTGDLVFVVSESGQVGINMYTGESQLSGDLVTPYQFHVSGVTVLSGAQDLNFNTKPALTVAGNTELHGPLSGRSADFTSLSVSGNSVITGLGFTGLSDTPSSLEANQFLRVSSDATGLIYNDLSGVVTSETLDWLNYTSFSDLPNATYHHGMFAHVHSEGAAYMAHAGGWTKIYPLVTGAEGLGDGSGVFKEISSYNLQFKSLLGGDNVRITGDGSTLTFDVTGISGGSTTGITGASNLGAGSALASGVSGSDLYLKSLVGGTNVTLSSDDNTITINSSAGGGGGGTGEVCISGTGPASLPKVKARSNFSGRLPDVIYGLFTDGSYRTACYFTSIEDEGLANDRIFYHPLEYSVGFPYLAFENDSTGAFKLAVEVTAETGSDGENLSLQQYIDNGHAAFYNSGCGSGGGGGGTGITGATNLGAGSGLISGITDNDLQVKSLVGGTNLQITGDGESLYLNVTGVSGFTVSGITGASNIGIGSGILSGISDNDLVFRTIEAGPNVNITESSSGLKVSATTSAFVSGGSVSGGIGLNPFISGYSNFYTTLPDQIILQSFAPNGSPPIPYTLNFFDLNPYIYYENTAAASHSIARFDNDSLGSNGTFLGTAYYPNPLGSLSGLIGSGRGVYLGGL